MLFGVMLGTGLWVLLATIFNLITDLVRHHTDIADRARANRAINISVASLYIPVTVFNAVGESSNWAPLYGLSIGTEVVLLAFILRSACTWPRTKSRSLPV